MRFAIRCSAIILVFLAAGCGFTPDLVVLLPDSPLLIGSAKGKYLQLFAYQKSSKSMIETGWVPTDEVVGRTIVSFDWDAEIAAKGETNAGVDGSSSP